MLSLCWNKGGVAGGDESSSSESESVELRLAASATALTGKICDVLGLKISTRSPYTTVDLGYRVNIGSPGKSGTLLESSNQSDWASCVYTLT